MSRYGFSTSLKRAASAYFANKKMKEREAIIATQTTKQIKAGPFYSISSFDFSLSTRTLRISFCEKNKYRKIVKYVTVNYVRHPIYSDVWYEKSKEIKKVLKLTNRELEMLNNNPDPLIKKYKFEIIDKLNNEDLIPSWYIKHFLDVERDGLIRQLKEELKKNLDDNIVSIELSKREIAKESEKIKPLLKTIKVQTKKLSKIDKKTESRASRKKNVFLSVLTLGIYGYLLSDKCKKSLESKRSVEQKKLDEATYEYNKTQELIKKHNDKIEFYKEDSKKRQEKYNLDCEKIKKDCETAKASVAPLPSDASDSEDFIPLKQMNGFEYQKIIGCYIIHNKEKDKYYVGQSKDVYKRVLRDHFNGTEVKNIIFAEDYYTSEYENKDDIFEVKIIRCETKDELDKTEAELIEKYDSFRNGYNGTGGNK